MKGRSENHWSRQRRRTVYKLKDKLNIADDYRAFAHRSAPGMGWKRWTFHSAEMVQMQPAPTLSTIGQFSGGARELAPVGQASNEARTRTRLNWLGQEALGNATRPRERTG